MKLVQKERWFPDFCGTVPTDINRQQTPIAKLNLIWKTDQSGACRASEFWAPDRNKILILLSVPPSDAGRKICQVGRAIDSFVTRNPPETRDKWCGRRARAKSCGV